MSIDATSARTSKLRQEDEDLQHDDPAAYPECFFEDLRSGPLRKIPVVSQFSAAWRIGGHHLEVFHPFSTLARTCADQIIVYLVHGHGGNRVGHRIFSRILGLWTVALEL